MKLDEFFAEHPKAALAFSGGTDSAFLLYAARSAGADVRPYLVKSQFQPEFEYEDAVRLSGELGAELRVVNADILQYDEVTANPGNRCYFCKKRIMGAIRAAAVADGYETMIDGTNASDECGDRPGMKVLEEQHILSPLRICGLTKSDVRRLSKEPLRRAKRFFLPWAFRTFASGFATAARCCNLRKNSSAGRRRCSEKSRQNC